MLLCKKKRNHPYWSLHRANSVKNVGMT
uniref:Uncharacterized protein n=1 Tax=Rhizophora mucronata TaxID=61149 RepID=A0A2P2NEC6_RHIMU